MNYVAVSLLTPAGGPIAGGTALRVDGVGLRDLSGGVSGVRLQGMKCKFGENDMVPAVRRHRRSSALCTAPADGTWGGANASEAPSTAAFHEVPLELTFNGYDTPGTLTASGVSYAYYDATLLSISHIHPTGGPAGGGTELIVYLTDERLLVDLGGVIPPPSLEPRTAAAAQARLREPKSASAQPLARS